MTYSLFLSYVVRLLPFFFTWLFFVYQAREKRLSGEKQMRSLRSSHDFEGRVAANKHQKDIEKRAEAATMESSFAGLMGALNWDIGAESAADSIASTVSDFSRFTAFG